MGKLLLIIILLNTSLSCFAKAPELEYWEENMDADTWRRVDQLGEKLYDVLFSSLESLKIYQYKDDRIQAKIGIDRRVFDNLDVPNSWSVLDRVELSGLIPLFSSEFNIAPQLGPLSFFLGADFGVEFINIRKVRPEDYFKLPSFLSRHKDFQNAPAYKEFIARKPAEEESDSDSTKGRWVYTLGKDSKSHLSYLPLQSPQASAFLSNLSNILFLPFRIPLTAALLSYMDDSEIISYVGTGAVSVGASVGWSLDPGTDILQAGISYSTYVNGTFRITVMKEDSRFVRVKVTQTAGGGHGAVFGWSSKPNFLDGIILVKDLVRYIKVIPFQLSSVQDIRGAFDVGYRYDLTIDSAREAYELAVRGQFVDSDELANNPKGPAATGVEKIFERKSQSKTTKIDWKVRIGFLFSRNQNQSLSTVASTITLPDGTHEIFRARSDSSEEWKLLWAIYEKFNHSFIVNVDLDQYEKDPKNPAAFTFTTEAQIQDSDTTDFELNDYIAEVENAVGKPKLFPRILPNHNENDKDWNWQKLLNLDNLGKSHFLYRIDIPNETIQKFINTPEEKMWGLLEKAFKVSEGSWKSMSTRIKYFLPRFPLAVLNVPGYFAGLHLREGDSLWHADNIYEQWKRTQWKSDVRKRAESLAKVFFDPWYGYELAHLIRATLESDPVAYYASGYNQNFGRIVHKERTDLRFDDVTARAEKIIDFDRPRPALSEADLEASVLEMTTAQIDANKVELKFKLKNTPKIIFFQVHLDNTFFDILFGRWKWPFKSSKLVDLLYFNSSGLFNEGDNVMVLDRAVTDSPWFEMAKHFEPSNRYLIRMAVNTTGFYWGPVIQSKLRLLDQ